MNESNTPNSPGNQDLEAGVVEPERALPEVALDGLPQALREAVARAGWPELLPVQSRAIPYLLAGRDLLVQSRTGSGKTGAYLLPMLERLDPRRPVTQALVLTPTRELARQVAEEAGILAGAAGMRTAAVYGGVAYGPQIQALRAGTQLVVGTPGRILDHLLKRNLSLQDLRMLVFDEADRMLSMGFYQDMRAIQRYLPSRDVQVCMFSATFPTYVRRLAGVFLKDPDLLSLSSDHVHVTDVQHMYSMVPGMDKDRSLVRIIEVEMPPSALIFCNTRSRVNYVTAVLQRFGYDADELSSDLSQEAREKIMARIRQGTLRFLVATDVASRGIDLPDLSHVFLYEVPDEAEQYIHRAGRTGRAGGGGVVISLVDPVEKLALNRIAKRYGIEMQEWPLPSDEDVQAVVGERLIVLLEARLRERGRLEIERMERFEPLAGDLIQNEEGRALLAMLLDDYYQQALYSRLPPPGSEPEPATQAAQSPRRPAGGRRRGGRRR